ncbi:bifunctional proline dehydrogenase/L-glutamate gamma-semialdehyde dehydrogenase PutA [Paracoccus aminophilus]|uniref:Bifunctional protein PutA n=1 Tax=Paracoccus aminophilus JCM 7686 TaxID=1367847 RepID=S5YB79_PARAH|nr:bifunctional proline dehydrogenase/L-glutamate gamma-semialdehyde dehydrogenase PutA [Paracoccus aminophilus]AGT08698.1 1-pyrroline-5-carboxylate dehydrogenase [Paracoccus aminophilus JCM 7686]
MSAYTPALAAIDAATLAPEAPLLTALIAEAALDAEARARIARAGADLVSRIRAQLHPGLMEVFLAEYGLSTEEGLALMSLAEALLRVPDAETSDALIEDKIAPADWKRHKGRSKSSLVNISTRGLILTGGVLDRRDTGVIRSAVRRLGQPVIRAAVTRAMREMGRQFVLGQTIEEAMKRAAEDPKSTQSYDMLGEAAMTAGDARKYEAAYAKAITAIASACVKGRLRDNPGISVKLSALHPRYETAQEARVLAELVPIVTRLARAAAAADMPLTIDAEESYRLTLSLQVIEAVLADPALAGWEGFGIVVQAYGRRAGPAIDWLYDMASRLDRKVMIRLVKGAYWDAEIKRAQVTGLPDFPVYTRKVSTDASYIGLARRLLAKTDRIYPQFATHNAHTVCAILDMAKGRDFEFQRLHGMGEGLHKLVQDDNNTRLRIYAPVGAHRELLAYLVRRLLENGANSSFVNQIVDEAIAPEVVAACPLTAVEKLGQIENPAIARGTGLFTPERENSRGHDIADRPARDGLLAARLDAGAAPKAVPLIVADLENGPAEPVENPATLAPAGSVHQASAAQVEAAIAAAQPWSQPASARAETLRRVADLYEADTPALLALLASESGKTLADAVAEIREAVDFLRYYAAQITTLRHPPRGIFTAISPWNFPLAIFTGQIAAALAAGNGVLAKPAEQTPLIAHHAVALMHRAGVPVAALQLLPGDGASVGAALTSDARISGVVFTGSTETAKLIRRAMAEKMAPTAPLIAETGGLNAMVVDSTALPEQAVRDIVTSAFQSAGQRCSALRCLYLQEDIAGPVLEMLSGAMDELALGNPAEIETDIGPVIDLEAAGPIRAHIAKAASEGRLIKQLPTPEGGHFIGPAMLRVGSIAEMKQEIFGPVLHVATFPADALDKVVAEINATGYGLTFGLHSRIASRIQSVAGKIHAGNAYVNRNQIGAVVGSQPFGGEGLSGTGPKAGGPEYVARFTAAPVTETQAESKPYSSYYKTLEKDIEKVSISGDAQRVLDLPGPTGELNQLSLYSRDPILCLGPGYDVAKAQAAEIARLGGYGIALDGVPDADWLARIEGISGAVWWGDEARGRGFARALATRPGPILPLIGAIDKGHVVLERHLCIDTTASGGNAALLAGEALAIQPR